MDPPQLLLNCISETYYFGPWICISVNRADSVNQITQIQNHQCTFNMFLYLFLYDLISFPVSSHLLIVHSWTLPHMHRHSFFYQEQHIFRSELCVLHISSISIFMFLFLRLIYQIIERWERKQQCILEL